MNNLRVKAAADLSDRTVADLGRLPSDTPVLTSGFKHSIMNESRVNAAADLSDQTVEDLIWPKSNMVVSQNHSIISDLCKKAATSQSGQTAKDLVWLRFGTSW